MYKKILFFLASSMIIALITTGTGYSQYDLNRSYLGPSIGLSFLGSTFQIGAIPIY